MSFIINQNFDLKSPQFNFARDYFDNVAKLKAANENDFPDHFITNVAGDLYQLNKSYTPNDTTGKWRKLKLGSDVDLSGYATTASLNNHTTNKSNPHGVTKSQVGLGNVDNTSDAAKPVSTATQNALNTKVSKTSFDSLKSNYDNLEFSSETPFSTGTDGQQFIGLAFGDNDKHDNKSVVSIYSATTSKPGIMSTADKIKLDGIENTYAKKSDVSALSSALVYKGTIGTNGTITKVNVAAKVGDVYVAVAGAPAVNGVALEPGDMIIAKTAGDGTDTQPTWTAVQTNINGAVTSTNALADNTLILGNNNRAIKASSGSGFVKVINGAVSYNNDVVTTSDTLGASKLIIGKGNKNIQTASGTGFVKISDGVVLTDSSTYLTYVPTAKDNVVGGFKTGYTQNGKNYAVVLNDKNQAYVYVPWTDTNTTYPLASTSTNGLMSSADKNKLNAIQTPATITTSQLDLCGFSDYATLVNGTANQRDGLSFFVTDQNAIVTLQTDNGKHAIIQTIRTATELNNSWEFDTGATSSHKDGVLFTYQRFYPISGTYSTGTQSKWTKWAIIDVDTMYTGGRSDVNSVYKVKGKQLLSNLVASTDGKITFSSVYSGIDTNGIKSESKEILTPIPEATITGLF